MYICFGIIIGFIVVGYIIVLQKLNNLEAKINLLQYDVSRSYMGIRILCKLKHRIDLDKFYEEYENKIINKLEEINNDEQK